MAVDAPAQDDLVDLELVELGHESVLAEKNAGAVRVAVDDHFFILSKPATGKKGGGLFLHDRALSSLSFVSGSLRIRFKETRSAIYPTVYIGFI
jgi:hypothetical protein